MSQHFFNTVCESCPVRVSMGWDRPLQYYFLTVQVLHAEERAEGEDNAVGSEGFLYANLDDPSVPDVEHQLLYFQRQLALLSIEVPRKKRCCISRS